MKKCVLAEKVGMTQILSPEGEVLPVTVVRVDANTVLEIQPLEGKSVVLLGYKDKPKAKCNKPEVGRYAKIGVEPKKHLRSFQTKDIASFPLTGIVGLELFTEQEVVSVRGRSSGKGFAGTIKRHNFSRGPRSHGSKNYRAPGSIGAGTTPGRVLKGKRMAGHMGNAIVTVKNLSIVKIDTENGLMFLKGAVPGKPKAILEIFN